MYPFLPASGPIRIPMYNLCIGIGIILAMLLLENNKRYQQFPENTQFKLKGLIAAAIILGFAGAYIFDGITQGQILWNGGGGISILGGVLTATLIILVGLKILKLPFWESLNILTPSFAVAHCIGRVGCFLGGCCFGKPTSSFLGVCYPEGSPAWKTFDHHILPTHPTQLYEAGVALLYLLLLRYIPFNRRFVTYFVASSAARFFIEFLRADNRGTLFSADWLSPSQVLSLLLIVLALGLSLFRPKKLNPF